MLQALERKPILSIILLVLVMLVFSIDSIPVSIMEARNFITAREMVTDGNWLLTTMNGEARYEKPPLPTWMTAVFGLIFGFKNLIALRFPAIIFIGIIGVFTYLQTKRILNDTRHGLINGLIVITSFYIIGITLEASWDIFTHGFMLMGIYQLFQFFEKHDSYLQHAFYASLFIGCSILCKGPVSMYALLLPFIIAYACTYKFKKFRPKLVPTIGCILLAFLIGGWWYFYVRLIDPQTFAAIAERETSNWTGYNTRPFYYYWSFFTQSGIWTIPAFISLLYPYLKTRVKHLKAYQFTLLWTLFAVVLLSLIPEKKSRYLMPVLIPLAMNTGFYIEYLIRKFKDLNDKRELIPAYFNFGLIGVIGLTFPVVIYIFLGNNLNDYWMQYVVASLITISFGLLILIQLKKKHMKNVFLLTVLFFAGLLITALPLSKAIVDTNYNSISNLDHGKMKLYGLNYISPEMIWYSGDKIPPIKLDDGSYQLPEDDEFGLLATAVNPEDWTVLQTQYHIKKVETFDLNRVSADSKRYNDRLVNDFYILTRN